MMCGLFRMLCHSHCALAGFGGLTGTRPHMNVHTSHTNRGNLAGGPCGIAMGGAAADLKRMGINRLLLPVRRAHRNQHRMRMVQLCTRRCC